MAKRRKARRACVRTGKTIVCGTIVKAKKAKKARKSRKRRARK